MSHHHKNPKCHCVIFDKKGWGEKKHIYLSLFPSCLTRVVNLFPSSLLTIFPQISITLAHISFVHKSIKRRIRVEEPYYIKREEGRGRMSKGMAMGREKSARDTKGTQETQYTRESQRRTTHETSSLSH